MSRRSRADLHDADALRLGVDGADLVAHVAGLTRARTQAPLDRANVDGTRAVLDAVRASGGSPRVLVTSSLEAMGPNRVGPDGAPVPATERDTPQPVSMYGLSKARMEDTVRRDYADVGVTVVRPPAVYGPREADLYEMVKGAARGLFPIVGPADVPRVSMVYVGDLVRGMADLAERTRRQARPTSWGRRATRGRRSGRRSRARSAGETLALPVPGRVIGAVGALAERVGGRLGHAAAADGRQGGGGPARLGLRRRRRRARRLGTTSRSGWRRGLQDGRVVPGGGVALTPVRPVPRVGEGRASAIGSRGSGGGAARLIARSDPVMRVARLVSLALVCSSPAARGQAHLVDGRGAYVSLDLVGGPFVNITPAGDGVTGGAGWRSDKLDVSVLLGRSGAVADTLFPYPGETHLGAAVAFSFGPDAWPWRVEATGKTVVADRRGFAFPPDGPTELLDGPGVIDSFGRVSLLRHVRISDGAVRVLPGIGVYRDVRRLEPSPLRFQAGTPEETVTDDEVRVEGGWGRPSRLPSRSGWATGRRWWLSPRPGRACSISSTARSTASSRRGSTSSPLRLGAEVGRVDR